jgi:hypothetical protein
METAISAAMPYRIIGMDKGCPLKAELDGDSKFAPEVSLYY